MLGLPTHLSKSWLRGLFSPLRRHPLTRDRRPLLEILEDRITPAIVNITGMPTATVISGYPEIGVYPSSFVAGAYAGFYANYLGEEVTVLNASFTLGDGIHVSIDRDPEANERVGDPVAITISLTAGASATDPRGSAQVAISSSNAPGQGIAASTSGDGNATTTLHVRGIIGDSFDINVSGSGSLTESVIGSFPELIVHGFVGASIFVETVQAPLATVDSAAWNPSGKLDVAYSIAAGTLPAGTTLNFSWTDAAGNDPHTALSPISIAGQTGSQMQSISLSTLTPPSGTLPAKLTVSILEPDGTGGVVQVPQTAAANLSDLQFTPVLSVPADYNSAASKANAQPTFGTFLKGVSLNTPFTFSAPTAAWSARLLTKVTFALPGKLDDINPDAAQPGIFTDSADIAALHSGSLDVNAYWGQFKLATAHAQIVVEDKVPLHLQAKLGSGAAVDLSQVRFIRGVTLNEAFQGDFGGQLPAIYLPKLEAVGFGANTIGVSEKAADHFVLQAYDVGSLPADPLVPSLQIGGQTFQTDGTKLAVIALPDWLQGQEANFKVADDGYHLMHDVTLAEFPIGHASFSIGFPDFPLPGLSNLESFAAATAAVDLEAPLLLASDAKVDFKNLHVVGKVLGKTLVDKTISAAANNLTVSSALTAQTLELKSLKVATANPVELYNGNLVDHLQFTHVIGVPHVADLELQLSLTIPVVVTGSFGLDVQFDNGHPTLNPASTFLKLKVVATPTVTVIGSVKVLGHELGTATATATLQVGGLVEPHFGGTLLSPTLSDPASTVDFAARVSFAYTYNVPDLNLAGGSATPADWIPLGGNPNFPFNSDATTPDDSVVKLQGKSPVGLLIVDPMGRRLGYDPTTGKPVNDFGSQATDSGPNTEPEILTLPLSLIVPGPYHFSAIGTGSGSYTIELQIASRDDPSHIVLDRTLATGMTSLGQPVAAISPLDILAELTHPHQGIPTPTVTLVATQTQGDSAFFGFTGSNNFAAPSILTFQTQLDNGVFTNAAGTSVNYANLAAGPHTFRVHAIDNAGAISPDVSFSWAVAAPAPPAGTGVGVLIGVVFLDNNVNGVQDTGEAGRASVTVYLDANNNGRMDAGEATTTTRADGGYTFANVAAGTYYVRVNAPFTLPTVPANGTVAVALGGGATEVANFGIIEVSPGLPVSGPPTIYAPPTSKTEPDADIHAFIRGLYHSVLNRDVEASNTTLAYWDTVFNLAKTTPQALGLPAGADPYLYVTQGFWNSQEHRWREVESYYHNFLGRDLDAKNAQDVADRQYWTSQLQSSGTTEADVVHGFLTSAAYLFQHRAEASLGDAVNASLLAGGGTTADLKAWTGRLGALDARRVAVKDEVFATADAYKALLAGNLASFDNESARTGVFYDVLSSDAYAQRALDSFYSAFLHRHATQSEKQSWLTQRDRSGNALDLGTVAERMLASPQYRTNAVGSVGL